MTKEREEDYKIRTAYSRPNSLRVIFTNALKQADFESILNGLGINYELKSESENKFVIGSNNMDKRRVVEFNYFELTAAIIERLPDYERLPGNLIE